MICLEFRHGAKFNELLKPDFFMRQTYNCNLCGHFFSNDYANLGFEPDFGIYWLLLLTNLVLKLTCMCHKVKVKFRDGESMARAPF